MAIFQEVLSVARFLANGASEDLAFCQLVRGGLEVGENWGLVSLLQIGEDLLIG